MNVYKLLLLFLSAYLLIFSGCGNSESDGTTGKTGTLSLNLTDAPLIDEDNVTGVFIIISGVEYHTTDGGWDSMEDFNTSLNPINLLEWQDGNTLFLGEVKMPAGKYTQLRFLLNAVEENKVSSGNPGCFIQFDGDRNETLYVPSGSQSGYKTVGNYDVPVNGTVHVTADFDVRKSVVLSGGQYKLKPTIRLIVSNEAGTINGSIGNLENNATYIMYTYDYENGISSWNDSEINKEFETAATSSALKENGTYNLPFLNAGNYDLILVKYDEHGEYETFYIIETEIIVQSTKTTTVDTSL